MASQNEYGNATEDFTHDDIVCNRFAEAALICDPKKVQWWNLHQLNECHPSLVKVPTMVVSLELFEAQEDISRVVVFGTNLTTFRFRLPEIKIHTHHC